MTQSTFSSLHAPVVLLASLLCTLLTLPTHGWFGKEQPFVQVSDPFIEMHTGPGRGYPVFYVAGEGEQIKILKRRTDWFKVELKRGEHTTKRGWVPLTQMRATLDLDGAEVDYGEIGLGDFATRRWEAGFSAGDFDGARTLEGYVAYGLTPNLSLRLAGTQILGSFSEGFIGSANIVMHPFPQWRVSPFFTIGTGIIQTRPQTTVVAAEDRTDEIVNVGAGANIYLTRRFVMNLEYRRHTVLTSRDENQEINEYKAGFSFFLGRH